MNWRKPIILFGLKISGSKIPQYLEEIKSLTKKSYSELYEYQNEKLKKILLHAYFHVPYYKKVLTEAKVINNNHVLLKNFSNIPILTKDIIRQKYEYLKSDDLSTRKSFENTSGGSTGEPVKFVQDQEYSDWNIANKIYYKTFGGQDIGDPEMRLWGSERDIINKKTPIKFLIKNWLYNRREINAFRLTNETMRFYVQQINNFRPSWIEGYAQPLYEIAKYIENNKLAIHNPKGILSSAGTLYPQMKQKIESVFQTNVFNRYGSREVGDMACSCIENSELHLSIWNHFLEILDSNNHIVNPLETGKVVVTTLNNFSMPLIRYKIGDIATESNMSLCTCEKMGQRIQFVEGRETSVFRSKDGKIVPAEFFIHFLGVVLNSGYISKFQVIQEEYDLIIIKVVVLNKHEMEKNKYKINDIIYKVMGGNCRIRYQFVDEIPTLPNGKYLYTISKIQ